jgi:hypothetical protein
LYYNRKGHEINMLTIKHKWIILTIVRWYNLKFLKEDNWIKY